MESREPVYYQIRRALLARIEGGEYTPGAQLPTEQELQEQFGVSRGTVRRALDELVFEGRIRRRSGKGTFVRELPPRVQTEEVLSFTEQVRRRGLLPSTQLIAAAQIAAAEAEEVVRGAFGLEAHDPVLRIRRLRLGDDRPLSLQTVYLLPALCPGILERNLAQLMPLYEACGISIRAAEEVIRVVEVEGEEADLLRLGPGEPVVFRQRVSFAADGRPVEVLLSLDRIETFELRHRLAAPTE